jgi:hypothetical protein
MSQDMGDTCCGLGGVPGGLPLPTVVERVDLGLQFGHRAGQRLFVEVAEQGLMETLVLALGGRLGGLAGDRLDTQETCSTNWPT